MSDEDYADALDAADAYYQKRIVSAFRAGFNAAFKATREGFNGESEWNHLVPAPFETRAELEEAALNAYTYGSDEQFELFLASVSYGT